MKCPRDFTPLVKLAREYKCPKCGFSRPRFIKPDNGSPLFVNLDIKDKETKKFLEDIQNPKVVDRSWYLSSDSQRVFIKENGKIVDVRRIEDFADERAKEIRKK